MDVCALTANAAVVLVGKKIIEVTEFSQAPTHVYI